MATPGELRLLNALSDGSVETYSPVIDDDGGVSYPDVEHRLDASDGEPYEVLESLTHRGILYREFQEKSYVCPDCRTDGMGYTTICTECGSANTIEQELLQHVDCGGVAPEEQFQVADGEYVCPKCELSVLPEQTEVSHHHVCQVCDETAVGSEGALRCRACVSVFEPGEAIEWVLYNYGLEQYGQEWLTSQLSARDALSGMLDERGFDVEIDTVVSADSVQHPVHLYGEENLLGDRVVGAVHERPDRNDIERLHDAAAALDARSVLVSTSEAVTDGADEFAHGHGVRILSHKQDDTLQREYTTATQPKQDSSVFERLTSSVRRQFN